MRPLSIPRHILDEMVAEAKHLAPHECCGLLAGKDGKITHHYKIKNIVATDEAAFKAIFDNDKIAHLERLSPAERADIAFWMDTRDMLAAQKDMRIQGAELLASYHSHPVSPARPSPTDIKALASYPDIVHVIVSLKESWIQKVLKSIFRISPQPIINAFRIVDDKVAQTPYQIA